MFKLEVSVGNTTSTSDLTTSHGTLVIRGVQPLTNSTSNLVQSKNNTRALIDRAYRTTDQPPVNFGNSFVVVVRFLQVITTNV